MQETRKQLLTDRFVQLVELLNQRMHCRPLDEWEGLDLTLPQFRALALLQHYGPQRMGSVSNYLGSTFSSATSIIDRLVDKELVERAPDPDDRRVVVCRLTTKGQDTFEKFWRIGRMGIMELVDPLNAEELETVVRAMELLCQASEMTGHIRELPRGTDKDGSD
jgi:DNA-binding MarR family transcriptional regulator